MALLEKMNYSEGADKLFLAGDLVNRGPYSAKVVRWVRHAMSKYPGFVKAVKGNHEEKHYRFYKHSLRRRVYPNYKIPMKPFSMEKLQVHNSLEDADLEFLGALPVWICLSSSWLMVHAGLEPGKSVENQDLTKVTRLRYLDPITYNTVNLDENYKPPLGSVYWTEVYDQNYSVVYGHNVHSLTTPKVTVKDSGVTLVGLDTGCCYGGHLSAFILPERGEAVTTEHFVQVKAKKQYSQNLTIYKE